MVGARHAHHFFRFKDKTTNLLSGFGETGKFKNKLLQKLTKTMPGTGQAGSLRKPMFGGSKYHEASWSLHNPIFVQALQSLVKLSSAAERGKRDLRNKCV